MISHQAIKEFLNRKLDNFDWIKELDDTELDKLLSKLTPPPVFHTKPFKHQKAVFYIAIYYHNYFMNFLDLGLGKTKSVLDVLNYRKMTGQPHQALVLVPNVANISEWVDQVSIHAPNLKCTPLVGTRDDRIEAIRNSKDSDLLIINYAGVLSLVTQRTKVEGRKSKKLVVNPLLIKRLKTYFNVIILDESTACKSVRSLTYQICRDLSKGCEARYALTGTPFGRDAQDLWSQFYVVDRGETLGWSYSLFREVFFTKKFNYWGGCDYKLRQGIKPKLYKTLKHRSIFYSENECPDLPEKVYITKKLKWTDEGWDYYTKTLTQVKNINNKTHQTLKPHFVRLRQMASGFVGFMNEITGEKTEIVFKENPKLDALFEIIDEMPSTSKMIIFHEFIRTGLKISEELKKRKLMYRDLWSGTKDQEESRATFINDPDCRFFVVNHASGSFGLNLQVANYVVFVESPVSSIRRRQAEKRCHRTGQLASRVFYYDLLMENSVDEKIRIYLKQGKDLFKALIEGKETL